MAAAVFTLARALLDTLVRALLETLVRALLDARTAADVPAAPLRRAWITRRTSLGPRTDIVGCLVELLDRTLGSYRLGRSDLSDLETVGTLTFIAVAVAVAVGAGAGYVGYTATASSSSS